MRNWGDGDHVSQWPAYDIPERDTFRPVWLWDRNSNGAVDPITGEFIPFTSAKEFIKEVTARRLYILVYRIKDREWFAPLEELLDDKRVKPSGLTRTGGFFGLYIKSRRSAWIVERRVWDDSVVSPGADFCNVLSNVWRINNRCAATPGALGERKIRETLPKGTRFNRPSSQLRRTLLSNKTGGRADTIEQKKHFGVLYEEDLNSSYPAMACETIDPGEHPVRFGTRGGLHVTDPATLRKFFSYYAYCFFSRDRNVRGIKFGVLGARDNKHRLFWPTEPGTIYSGWYWKEEIDRAIAAGYNVEIYEGYGWKRSSRWLEQWALEMFRLKTEYKGTPEGDIFKRESVAPIGRMGMSPERLTLVEKYEKGDIPVSISDAHADESPMTKWYIHIDPNPDANNLTHISSYIVMKGRVALYDRMLLNESSGTAVIASNYDSVYLLAASNLPHGRGLGDWKASTIENAYIYGPRSIKGVRNGTPFERRPGVKRRN